MRAERFISGVGLPGYGGKREQNTAREERLRACGILEAFFSTNYGISFPPQEEVDALSCPLDPAIVSQ